jgi:type II secretory pathway component PulC
MSKIGNFLKKFTRKDKKDQESDEEFYTDIESEDEFEEYEEEYDDVGETTVIFASDESSEQLIPHPAQPETQIPADSDLKFPDLPPNSKQENSVLQKENNSSTPPPMQNTQEVDLESLQGELDNIIGEDEDTDDNFEEELVDIEEEPEEQELEEISLQQDIQENEISKNELLNPDDAPLSENIEIEDSIEEEEEEKEDEDDVDFEDSYTEDQTGLTATNTIDLDEEKISLKDRLEHIKTRAGDHLRKFNKKDLNHSFKIDNEGSRHKNKIDNLKKKALSINWGNIPLQFFNKNNRSKYHRYFQVSLIIICVYGGATLIGHLFPSQKDYKSLSKRKVLNFDDSNSFTQSELNDIKNANVFRTEKVKKVIDPNGGKTKVEKGLCKTATRTSRANIKLINTIVLQDSVKSIASVQMRSSNKLVSIREGEKHQGVRIDTIQRLKLVVRNMSTQECETIENSKFKDSAGRNKISVLTPSASKKYKKTLKKIDGIENDGNNFKIDREFLKSKLSNINSILTQARGIQINNPDGTISFKIVDIEPGGIFAYLGMEDGDIISGINGEPITELNAVMNIFGRISSLSSLNLTLKRNGEETTQNYNIK